MLSDLHGLDPESIPLIHGSGFIMGWLVHSKSHLGQNKL